MTSVSVTRGLLFLFFSGVYVAEFVGERKNVERWRSDEEEACKKDGGDNADVWAVNSAGKENKGNGKGEEEKGKETVINDGEGRC